MIQSFADDATKRIWEGESIRRIPADLQRQALKRLTFLNLATKIEDLYIPPSNHFHTIGKRYAIRVNLQWRITFAWSELGRVRVLTQSGGTV